MNKSTVLWLLGTFATVVIALACGGSSQTPPETPAEPSTEPYPEPTPTETTDAGMPEGQHTMPDGSTMPGHEH